MEQKKEVQLGSPTRFQGTNIDSRDYLKLEEINDVFKKMKIATENYLQTISKLTLE